MLFTALVAALAWTPDAVAQSGPWDGSCVRLYNEDGSAATQEAGERLRAAVVERLRALGNDVDAGHCPLALEIHVRAVDGGWRVRAWGDVHIDRWMTAPNADILTLTTDVARVLDRSLVDTDPRRLPSSRRDRSARPSTDEDGVVWFPEIGVLRSRLFGTMPPQPGWNTTGQPHVFGLRWGESQIALTAGFALRLQAHRARGLQLGIYLDPRGSRDHEVLPAWPATRSVQVSLPVLWRLRLRNAGRGDDHFIIGFATGFEVGTFRFSPSRRAFHAGPRVEYPQVVAGWTLGLQHELRPSIRRDGSLRRREVSVLVTMPGSVRPQGGLAGFEMSARWRIGR